jgi:hypothetical protein
VGQPVAAVRDALQEDPTLWELLDTPLMLTIVTLAYSGEPVRALPIHEPPEAQRRHLFAVYVDRMFQRRSTITQYTRQQTERWLAWLARAMQGHSQTMFYLEWMQPDWLPRQRQQRLVTLLTVVMSGLLGGLGGGLLCGVVNTLLFGLWGVVSGLLGGLDGGLLFGLGVGLGARYLASCVLVVMLVCAILPCAWYFGRSISPLYITCASLTMRQLVSFCAKSVAGMSSYIACCSSILQPYIQYLRISKIATVMGNRLQGLDAVRSLRSLVPTNNIPLSVVIPVCSSVVQQTGCNTLLSVP